MCSSDLVKASSGPLAGDVPAGSLIVAFEGLRVASLDDLWVRLARSLGNPARVRLAACLDEGGSAMLSIRHKGRGQSGTHIVAVQAVEADGIRVDDPFGSLRGDYDANRPGDGYSSARGGARDRDRKNVVDRGNPDDWHMSATLADNEVKGQSSLWSDATVSSAWQYVVLFRRGTTATAP